MRLKQNTSSDLGYSEKIFRDWTKLTRKTLDQWESTSFRIGPEMNWTSTEERKTRRNLV